MSNRREKKVNVVLFIEIHLGKAKTMKSYSILIVTSENFDERIIISMIYLSVVSHLSFLRTRLLLTNQIR